MFLISNTTAIWSLCVNQVPSAHSQQKYIYIYACVQGKRGAPMLKALVKPAYTPMMLMRPPCVAYSYSLLQQQALTLCSATSVLS